MAHMAAGIATKVIQKNNIQLFRNKEDNKNVKT
jgi:hypothetical protein